MKSRLLTRLTLRVTRSSQASTATISGHLQAGGITLACGLGKTGVSRGKREGDKATPTGTFRLLHGYWRADRIPRPQSLIPLRALTRRDGWSDASESSRYNRPVTLPVTESHEEMWRQDELYDIVLVMDYNIAPRRRGRGSAIFFHCARPGLRPTLGCIALPRAQLRKLLPRLSRDVVIEVL